MGEKVKKKSTPAEKAERMSKKELEVLKKSAHGDHRQSSGAEAKFGFAKKAVKSAGWLSLAKSAVLGVIGVIVVLNPDTITTLISYLLGGILLVFGVYQLVNYFAVRGMYDFSNNQLLGGVVAFLLGVVVIMLGAQIGGILRIVIGIWLIYEALVRMNTAVKLKVAKVRQWLYVLIVAMVMMLIGVFILLNSGAVMQIIGWAMIVTAVLGAFDDVVFLSNVDELLGEK